MRGTGTAVRVAVVSAAVLWASSARAELITDSTGFFGSGATHISFDDVSPGLYAFPGLQIGPANLSGVNGSVFFILNDAGDGNGGAFGFALGGVGTIQIDFRERDAFGNFTGNLRADVNRIGFDYSANTNLHVDVFDINGNLLNSGQSGGVMGTGFLGWQDSTNIAYIWIHDAGGTFTIDDVRFEAGLAAPEPSTLVLAGISLAGTGLLVSRRRRRTR